MATKKEDVTPVAPEEVDPFASIELLDPKTVPTRSAQGRPPSPLCLKFREQLEASLKDRQVRSIPVPLDKKEDFAGQMHRAGNLSGHDPIKSSYRYDVIRGMFRFAPAEVWAEAKEGK